MIVLGGVAVSITLHNRSFVCFQTHLLCVRLGPIKASPGVPLSPAGTDERFTFGSVRHKKGDILFGMGDSGEW